MRLRSEHWLAVGGGAWMAALLARWSAAWAQTEEMDQAWLVPVLASYLFWERWTTRPAPPPAAAASSAGAVWPRLGLLALGLAGATSWLGLRLVLEPFPQWPLPLWAATVLGLTAVLGLLAGSTGRGALRHFAFPLAFCLLALPWPAALQMAVLPPLREALAHLAAEILNLSGYPALPQGTVIQLGRAWVGIDEACGGVRSLQAALTVAMFLGELWRLSLGRRGGLLAGGLAAALLTNLGRTLFLSWQGAAHGAAGVDRWHDLAAQAQLVLCLGAVALWGWWLERGAAPRDPPSPRPSPPPPPPRPGALVSIFPLRACALASVLLVVGAEVCTWAWYLPGAARRAAGPAWTLELPRQAPGYRADPFTANMAAMLKCDRHQLGHWRNADGQARAAYVLDWERGQQARFAPVHHRPESCLPLSGNRLLALGDPVEVPINPQLTLQFRPYTFASASETFFVFHVVWDLTENRPLLDLAAGRTGRAWFATQAAEILARRRDRPARAMAIAIHGARDVADALAQLRAELPAWIRSASLRH